MPRQHRAFDEQYLKETCVVKEKQTVCSRDHLKAKHAKEKRPAPPAPAAPPARPTTCAGEESRRAPRPAPAPAAASSHTTQHQQYASSSMLEEAEAGGEDAEGGDALKTRSLPGCLRARPRPLSAEGDLHQLCAKVGGGAEGTLSTRHKRRMRSEHAAIIALSKSRGQLVDADAVVVYDQRTQL